MSADQINGPLLLADLERLAGDTFESPEALAQWLRRPHPMLEGKTPLQAAQSKLGADQVRSILVAIKHGGVL